MTFLLGFLIAMAVGLTGIGGGSFTVPALILLVGLPVNLAVGTAFLFAAVLRTIAAPFYAINRWVHVASLWPLLTGAVPGLLVGTVLLRLWGTERWSPVVVILIGTILAISSSLTFIQDLRNPVAVRKVSRWLPWLGFPLGLGAGFSSAGAGALGTVLLLNYSEVPAPQVVGTNVILGLVLAVLGSGFHLKFGSVSKEVFRELLAGGIPGILVGCLLIRRVPSRQLRKAVALLAMLASAQLVWSGMHTWLVGHGAGASNVAVSQARWPPRRR